MKKILLSYLITIVFVFPTLADEGMWIPMLLKKYNIEDMQKAGFKLTAEDIYDINQASLKDAVIGLGRKGSPFHHFCTGNIVSEQGLVITNHHCAFNMIQSHTTLEKNYLRDGFWAKTLNDELANDGITASILVKMEDVTAQINSRLKENMTEEERANTIKDASREIERNSVQGTNLKASIKPYFNGNQYFLSVFKIFEDVRLVGAPNSAIGKFGGDTDNWTWPRHTGDFAVLRIYAGADNEPAEFSVNNKPYRPGKYFKVSAKGVEENDFTFVFGYPGTTNEYLTSYAIDQIADIENPHKIDIRTAKLNIINNAMNSDELLRIKYAAKAASVANAWKKWIGESNGLKRFNTADNKRVLEAQFNNWVRVNNKTEYVGLLGRYSELYKEREKYILADVYVGEAGLRGAEIINFISRFNATFQLYENFEDKEAFKLVLKELTESFYKDYDYNTDLLIFEQMLVLYNNDVLDYVPSSMEISEKAKTDAHVKMAEKIYKKSIFTHKDKLISFIENFTETSKKKVEKDPLFQVMNDLTQYQREEIRPELQKIENELSTLNRKWMAGLMEMQKDKVFYPDANSTLRVSYGIVNGFAPRDAVYYKHYTTLEGIMEKDNPDIYDYDVPQRLRDLYIQKDYGRYATQKGEMPVCFIATNHTTGGNSGSPVLNADGHLIGLNFDRAWEGVMSDMQYSPEICRNISVDIRYVLFIIDKFANAGHLLREMDIDF